MALSTKAILSGASPAAFKTTTKTSWKAQQAPVPVPAFHRSSGLGNMNTIHSLGSKAAKNVQFKQLALPLKGGRQQGVNMVATEHKVATSTTLTELFEKEGQSPWLDNLKRDWIQNGELQAWIDRGVRGITSNPTIFQKAIEGSNAYDEQFRKLIEGGMSVEDSYWELVKDDIGEALKLLRPLYDEGNGGDGYVSIEVGPELARDPEGTLAEARKLHKAVGQPNLLVKVPATQEGIEPIRVLTSEGISVNVTLIFSLKRYEEVMEAYVSGLEQHEGDLSKVASVASFFISRVENEVDRRLDAIGTPQALALKGKAAVAQGKLAYELFQKKFSGPRWEELAARGARVQRPLWASTGTKNKAYSDVLYIEGLIGPQSVNTIPDATLTAFLDHGKVQRSVDVDVMSAKRLIFGQLAVLGVELDDVSRVLEEEGVASFQASGLHVFGALEAKAALLKAEKKYLLTPSRQKATYQSVRSPKRQSPS